MNIQKKLSTIIAVIFVLFVTYSSALAEEVVYYADATAADQGTTGIRTIKGLADAIGSTKNATIVLAKNSNSTGTTYTVSKSITITSNINLKVEPGALVSIATNKILTINGPFESSRNKVFSCSGTGKVVFGASAVDTIDPTWFGFSTTATAVNNTIYFHQAVASMAAGHNLIIPPGTFPITNIVFNPPNDSRLTCYGILQGDAAGIAFLIGSATGTTPTYRLHISNLYVTSSAKDHTPGRVGVEVRNVEVSYIHIRTIAYYETGLKVLGSGYDTTYNSFYFGTFWDNKYTIHLLEESNGAVNENNFFGGSTSWAGREDTTGFRHIWIDYSDHSNPNNNRFWGFSMESGTSTGSGYGTGIYCEGGGNQFYGPRFEMGTGDTRAYFTSHSSDNVLFYGIGSNTMAADIVDNGQRNKFFLNSENRLSGNASTGILGIANESGDGYKVLNILDHTKANSMMSVDGYGDIYHGVNKVVSARSTGWTTMAGTAVKNNGSINTDLITASDANIQALAKAVKALMDALIAHGLIGP